MIDPYIAKALIEISLFFEFSDDQIIDPDAAVAAMEQMASTLQRMDSKTKADLVMVMQSLGSDYPENSTFVSELPAALGLMPD